jgi:CubicO group peptidase (beta-lactamase class C family)
MAAEPGATFRYNSGATQVLAYVFRKATGIDLEEYAARHLFAPLGIDRYFWKRSPSGLIDAEGGLFLRPRDLARIAYLYLHDGSWNGTAVVTPEWVKQSVAPSIDVSRDGVKYGFKWWLYPYGPAPGHLAFAGSGFGGQRPIVLPEYDLVCVFTGWNVLPDRPSLSPRTAIDRVIAAISDRDK